MNKLVYLSSSILEMAKIVMYVFYRQFHCTNKKTKDVYKGFAKMLMIGLILQTIGQKDCYQK